MRKCIHTRRAYYPHKIKLTFDDLYARRIRKLVGVSHGFIYIYSPGNSPRYRQSTRSPPVQMRTYLMADHAFIIDTELQESSLYIRT